ncbi:hemerythrin domain-containing protein [Neisseria zalophi]|uniref:Hemerythrin domain-containing protein n=1 Tax=Neisseria zalophi TaxID=640030 RepID=A0A5J6PWL7_9NEIS|nr:hemerythrin domain-containing protein [Neisseria zalophi]QEY25483.1 hemerythrin domain-containing protein [Neisseria zalophi]
MNPFDTKSATFNEPIEMLYACHGKVRRFCSQIGKLPEYIDENGCNNVALQAVHQISRYFNIAAPLHHQDEEEDFFPLLLQYYPQAKPDIEQLLKQHNTLHNNWTAVSQEFAKLEADPNYQLKNNILQRFCADYDTHLNIEERLFEMGKHIPQKELAAIGKKMADRRKS